MSIAAKSIYYHNVALYVVLSFDYFSRSFYQCQGHKVKVIDPCPGQFTKCGEQAKFEQDSNLCGARPRKVSTGVKYYLMSSTKIKNKIGGQLIIFFIKCPLVVENS